MQVCSAQHRRCLPLSHDSGLFLNSLAKARTVCKDTLIPIFFLRDSSDEDAARSSLVERSKICKFAPRILSIPPSVT